MSIYTNATQCWKIIAAKRALGIVNRLPPGELRAFHVSRVFTNLNKLRAV